MKKQKGGMIIPIYRPKQMKEEDYARKFLESVKVLESQMKEHLKQYFLIKKNLFAAALFLYIYTNPNDDFWQTYNDILARRRAAKIEANITYFIKCSEVDDPLIVFNPEFFPLLDEVKKYYSLVLAKDCSGFESNRDVASVLRKMFTTALELPKEIEIEEQIHVPTDEVSLPLPKSALLGYMVESVIKKKVSRRRVYFH